MITDTFNPSQISTVTKVHIFCLHIQAVNNDTFEAISVRGPSEPFILERNPTDKSP